MVDAGQPLMLFCPVQNLKRVAETWMDEFAEYIYQRRPEYRHLSTGDLSAQKELRRQLKCKDFRWFMAAVAWDVPRYYPPVEPPPAAWGEVRRPALQHPHEKQRIYPPVPSRGGMEAAEALCSLAQRSVKVG